MDTDPQFVTALARGIDVLRCFTAERPELGSTEIANLIGLPQSTVWRLCHTLMRLGCLVPGRNPAKLRIGLGALTLGQASLLHSGLAEIAYPGMKEIADQFDAQVSLAGRNGLEMVIVQRAEAATILRLHLHVGSTLAIARSALGWAYVAACGEAERPALIEAVAASTTEPQATRSYLLQAVDDYRRDGFVLNPRVYHPEVNAVGVPVLGGSGRVIMALNCGGAASVVTLRKLRGAAASRLQELAARLGRVLDSD